MEVVQQILAFIVVIGILVTFHEFGHYWVAKRCGVKILCFSVGFGRALWTKRFGPDQTEFVIAALPLGGYVKMLDEREGEVPEQELDRAFNRKPLGQRFAIVFAGPLFNLIFAVAAYALMYTIGLSGVKPLVDQVEPASIAARAGLEQGDEIAAVGDRATGTWASVSEALIGYVVDGEPASLRVRDPHGGIRTLSLNVTPLSLDDIASSSLLEQLGIEPRRPRLAAKIDTVTADSPAAQAGLKSGDEITAVDGEPLADWFELVATVQARAGESLNLTVLRAGEKIHKQLTPEAVILEDGSRIGRIGITVDTEAEIPAELRGRERHGPLDSLVKGVVRTGEMSWLTLQVLGKVVSGEASIKNLSGPISIAQYAGYSAAIGLAAFLGFLAIVSVSLGVLNLLPVPLLDGGHLMYYLIELVKGSPVSESVQAVGQQIGLVLLLGLMSVVIYNDIARVLS